MRIAEIKININRKGYVKNDDEIIVMIEEVQAIVEPLVDIMKEKLDQAGYEVAVSE
jgi:hypothetical protein